MIELLINTVNKKHSNPVKDARGCWKKGYVVSVKNTSNWGGCECLPNFIKVRITDINEVSEIQEYLDSIKRVMSHTIIEHDATTDTLKVRIHADPASLGAFTAGEATEAELLPIIELWEGKNTSKHIDGGMYSEFTALDVIKGEGHFSYGAEEEFITYEEAAYDPVSGEHDIELDMSLTKFKPEDKDKVEKVVKDKHVTVVSHDTETAKMKIKVKRNDMMSDLGLQVEETLNMSVSRVRYKLSDTKVDEIISAGGLMEMTKAEYISHLEDLQNG